jgi:tetratricopeptide (TPR) repeat protein
MKFILPTYPVKWGLLLWLVGTALSTPATAQLFYAEQIYQEGIVLYEQGRFEDAYRKFQEYEQQGVPDKKFYVYFAVSAARSGHEDAVDILRRGLQRFPGDADLTLLLIQFLAEQHHFREAMEYLEKARPNIVPEEYRQFMGGLAFNQGVLLYQEGQKKASIPYFRQAVEYQPNEPRFIRNLAVVLWETGNQQEAIAVLEKGVRRFPNDKEMNRLLIAFYEKTQNLTALREKLEEWAHRSGELADYLVLGQFYLYTGAEPEARKLFKMLEQKFPHAREVYTVQVRFYQGLMQFQRADSVLSRMEKVFPADTLTCRLKAENFEKMEKLSEAARYWQKCTQLAPKKEDFHFRLLRTLEKTDTTAYFRHLTVMDSLFQKPEVRLKIALEWYRHGKYNRAQVILKGVREQ